MKFNYDVPVKRCTADVNSLVIEAGLATHDGVRSINLVAVDKKTYFHWSYKSHMCFIVTSGINSFITYSCNYGVIVQFPNAFQA